jgi:hypothetical protein
MTDSGPDRGRRLEHQQRAYELQLIGGLRVSLPRAGVLRPSVQ